MIARFFRDKTGDRVAIDAGPLMRQKKAGCDSMFQNAERFDGLFISDEPVAGWLEGKIVSDYLHGYYPEYGMVAEGWLNRIPWMAAGFQMKAKVWWRTGNEAYRLNLKDFTAYLAGDKDQRTALLAKLPPEAIVVPVIVKKLKRQKEPTALVDSEKVPF